MTVPATWTQADVDKLKVAVGSGVLTVHYDGPPARSVTYQDLATMMRLLAQMVAQVNRATRRGYRLAATKKGI